MGLRGQAINFYQLFLRWQVCIQRTHASDCLKWQCLKWIRPSTENYILSYFNGLGWQGLFLFLWGWWGTFIWLLQTLQLNSTRAITRWYCYDFALASEWLVYCELKCWRVRLTLRELCAPTRTDSEFSICTSLWWIDYWRWQWSIWLTNYSLARISKCIAWY